MNIGVLDYGAGNLKNVCRAIEHLGYKYTLVSNKEEVLSVDKLVIPGVGAFKVAMEQLKELELIEPLNDLAVKGVPILGICLGMQLLFQESLEFGLTKGLGLLKGNIDLIASTDLNGEKLKVPHIGWNELIINDLNKKIIQGIKNDDPVYFVHSFRAGNLDDSQLIAYCIYGGHVLPAIVQRNNIVGCQFHPEKSGELGLKVFDNFLRNN